MEIKLNDYKQVTIKLINARTLKLTHNLESVLIKKNKSTIECLDFYGYKIPVGLDLPVKLNDRNYNYKIKEIIQTSQREFILRTGKLTKSSTYLFPLITMPNEDERYYCYSSYLENCYLYHQDFPDLNDDKHLFVQYRFFDTRNYKLLESIIFENKNFIKTYEPNNQFTIYIFEIPKQYHQDIQRFLEGKYSQISQNGKKAIVKFHELKERSSLVQILTKDSKLREQLEEDLGVPIPESMDLLDTPVIEEETCKIQKE